MTRKNAYTVAPDTMRISYEKKCPADFYDFGFIIGKTHVYRFLCKPEDVRPTWYKLDTDSRTHEPKMRLTFIDNLVRTSLINSGKAEYFCELQDLLEAGRGNAGNGFEILSGTDRTGAPHGINPAPWWVEGDYVWNGKQVQAKLETGTFCKMSQLVGA